MSKFWLLNIGVGLDYVYGKIILKKKVRELDKLIKFAQDDL